MATTTVSAPAVTDAAPAAATAAPSRIIHKQTLDAAGTRQLLHMFMQRRTRRQP